MFLHEQQHWIDETESTNDDLKTMAEDGAPAGTVIIAQKQHHGRGRQGRVWHGQPGDSLLFSALVRPPLSPQHWPMLPLMTAVAVQEALELLGIGSARIKWPNDLLVDGKKISGILCELSSEGTDLSYAVLGVGLNVNTPLEDMPDDIHDIACSMTSVCGHRFELKEVLDLILNRLDHWLDLSVQDGFESVRKQWNERNCTIGQFVTLDNGASHLSGQAVGIAESGALMLKDEQGKVHTVYSGDLHFGTDVNSM